MSNVRIIDPEPLDDFGKLWGVLRDIVNNSPLSRAEKIGILEVVKHEVLAEHLLEQRACGIPPPDEAP